MLSGRPAPGKPPTRIRLTRRRISGEEFTTLLANYETSAFRLEQQPVYRVLSEAGHVEAFLAGDPKPVDCIGGFPQWLDDIRRNTSAGRTMTRVRVHDVPPTDYQRWLRWVDTHNREAGEILCYVSRPAAVAAGITPDLGDWWLLDSTRLLRLDFDSKGSLGGFTLTDDPREIVEAKELAEALGWAASKITKIEHGQQPPKVPDIEAWVRACGADPTVALDLVTSLRALHAEHATWQRRFRSGQAVAQAAYNKLTAEATTVRFFETWIIPGLLQTPLYARRILIEAMNLSGIAKDDVDAAVMVRMQRQQALYDLGKRFEFLIAEPVLYWQACPPEVMRPQLDRLQTVIGLPNIRFGIFPYSAARKMWPQNSFCIYDDLAAVETFVGEITYRGGDARQYAAILDALWTNAVEGEDARRMVVDAIKR